MFVHSFAEKIHNSKNMIAIMYGKNYTPFCTLSMFCVCVCVLSSVHFFHSCAICNGTLESPMPSLRFPLPYLKWIKWQKIQIVILARTHASLINWSFPIENLLHHVSIGNNKGTFATEFHCIVDWLNPSTKMKRKKKKTKRNRLLIFHWPWKFFHSN